MLCPTKKCRWLFFLYFQDITFQRRHYDFEFECKNDGLESIMNNSEYCSNKG